MSDLNDYADQLHEFVAARGWDQYQNPKDLAMALGGEAGELLALLQWLTPAAAQSKVLDDAAFRRELGFELADILNYLLRLARSR
jgi:dCTP diphosphatase